MKKVVVIDCQHLRPQFSASFLLIENNRAIFIENNTAHALPYLLEALHQNGLKPDAVDYLIITHVHLDHAGGTSALLKYCPNAKVLAHPKAAKRVIDPSRLVESAQKVYGIEKFNEIYGKISPVPSDRVRSLSDNEELLWQGRQLKFFYTLGHASHHLCIWDKSADAVFTGDSFGLLYPALQSRGLFIFPSTSPIDFDPTEAKKSLQKITDCQSKELFLTHFGELTQIHEAQEQLNEHLDFHASLLQELKDKSTEASHAIEYCKHALKSYVENFFKSRFKTQISAEHMEILKIDIDLNAQGIVHRSLTPLSHPSTSS